MANAQAPRLDGFMCKLYKQMWDFVEPYLLQFYKEALKKQWDGIN